MDDELRNALNSFYSTQTEANTQVVGNRPWSKKIKSVALACHPSQIPEQMEEDRKRGVVVDYTADGRPVFEDRDQRKRYMRAYGFFDRDAGYGDAGPLFHKGKTPPPSRIRELARKLAHRIRVRRESRR